MQVKFMQSRKLGKVVYPKGVHEVDDAHAKDWFFQAIAKAGDVVVLPKAPSEADEVKPPKASQPGQLAKAKAQPQSQKAS